MMKLERSSGSTAEKGRGFHERCYRLLDPTPCCGSLKISDTTKNMEIPKYTANEERLLRKNRDLRDKVKSQECEILDGITHAGAWRKKLEEKSQLASELEHELESTKAKLARITNQHQ